MYFKEKRHGSNIVFIITFHSTLRYLLALNCFLKMLTLYCVKTTPTENKKFDIVNTLYFSYMWVRRYAHHSHWQILSDGQLTVT